MVIGQILGLPIAFGSGQLSGAGFGPNYTILMKLGYEFYAPRILDEMQKNPDKSFEDTEYWRAFQKHLKSYTDKVLLQTIDSLAAFPKQTLDSLMEKFGSYIADPFESSQTVTSTSASQLGTLSNVRLDLGQGFRRENPDTRQEGPSLFERDQQKKREQAEQRQQQQQVITKSQQFEIDIKKVQERYPQPNKAKLVTGATGKRKVSQSTKLAMTGMLRALTIKGNQVKQFRRLKDLRMYSLMYKAMTDIQQRIIDHNFTYTIGL